MFSKLLKEHHAKQSARRELQEVKRKEAITAANDLTHALVEHLNLGVAQAYLNQKKIEEEVKQLHFNMSQFSKQTHQWVTLIEGFNGALKQIGDLENWSRIIEGDMKFIADTLEHTYNEEICGAKLNPTKKTYVNRCAKGYVNCFISFCRTWFRKGYW